VISDPEAPFTIAFLGYANPAMSDQAVAYEDQVLPLLDDHGARLLYRGRRAEHEDTSLPLEIHLLWFPHRRAFESYMADGLRRALMQQFGEVFKVKQVVELETISGTVVM
jgi:hypothetical protein